jgi:hypothetical protein
VILCPRETDELQPDTVVESPKKARKKVQTALTPTPVQEPTPVHEPTPKLKPPKLKPTPKLKSKPILKPKSKPGEATNI